jgi:hypothetical protein
MREEAGRNGHTERGRSQARLPFFLSSAVPQPMRRRLGAGVLYAIHRYASAALHIIFPTVRIGRTTVRFLCYRVDLFLNEFVEFVSDSLRVS